MKPFPTAVLASVLIVAWAPAQAPERFDLVVRGGIVVDGSGKPGAPADVAVRGDRIVAVGDLGVGVAARTIEAEGLVVAPGFVDVHTHADSDAVRLPLADNFVRMGVTSIVTGNCGSSVAALGAHLARVEQDGVSVNYGSLVGHGTVRTGIMRTAPRAPTAGELNRMKERVAAAMREGALGMSTGLIYVPGTYARTEELIELAKVVAAHGGLYASHMRDEAGGVLASIDEALRIGSEAGCRVHLSHLKASGRAVWGDGAKIAARLEQARRAGAQVTGDQYLYTASSTSLDVLFPSAELSVGRKEFVAKLGRDDAFRAAMVEAVLAGAKDAGFADLAYCQVAHAPGHAECNGQRLPQVALALLGHDDPSAQARAACRLFVDAEGRRVSMIYHKMAEEDVESILRVPFVAVASDAGIRSRSGDDRPHPRGAGNNARLLGRYVRERRVVPLELAVQKMTSLPADVFGLADRGRIAPGQFADLVVFDPRRVADRATYEDPRADPIGIPWVIVNGVVVVAEGEHTGAKPGMVLRGAGTRRSEAGGK
ncbi:MAG: D-aminoacylase [Planctomycetota bacterium]